MKIAISGPMNEEIEKLIKNKEPVVEDLGHGLLLGPLWSEKGGSIQVVYFPKEENIEKRALIAERFAKFLREKEKNDPYYPRVWPGGESQGILVIDDPTVLKEKKQEILESLKKFNPALPY